MSAKGKKLNLADSIKKYPVGVACGLLCLVLIGAIFFRSTVVPEREALLEQRTAEGNRLTENLRNSAQLEEQHSVLVAANAEIDGRAVGLSGLGTNLKYFYQLESETGIKLQDLRQLVPASTARGGAAPKHLRVPFAVSLQGEFPKVMTFLRRLENGTHISRVNSASLTGATEVTLTLSIDLLGLP